MNKDFRLARCVSDKARAWVVQVDPVYHVDPLHEMGGPQGAQAEL